MGVIQTPDAVIKSNRIIETINFQLFNQWVGHYYYYRCSFFVFVCAIDTLLVYWRDYEAKS